MKKEESKKMLEIKAFFSLQDYLRGNGKKKKTDEINVNNLLIFFFFLAKIHCNQTRKN